jgi:hypothetical protein
MEHRQHCNAFDTILLLVMALKSFEFVVVVVVEKRSADIVRDSEDAQQSLQNVAQELCYVVVAIVVVLVVEILVVVVVVLKRSR